MTDLNPRATMLPRRPGTTPFRPAVGRGRATGSERNSSRRTTTARYISRNLGVLFRGGLIFKGGTSLSKVHTEFFRLSEDLDFTTSVLPDCDDHPSVAKPLYPSGTTSPESLTVLPGSNSPSRCVGHDNSRQYNGQLAYQSVVTGEPEFIKVEVSLREEHLLPPEILSARTLLRDPYSVQSAFPPVNVRALSLREAYAEKVRAALTRPEPAIRDFFDIDHAVQKARFDYRDRAVLDLVAAKLSVRGTQSADLSDVRIQILRDQVETQLRPVLRVIDYEAFDLDRVILVLQELMSLHGPV